LEGGTVVIDWPTIATALGYGSAKEMLTELYGERQLSIDTLSRKLQVSRYALRLELNRVGVPVRPAVRRKLLLSKEEIDRIRTEGVQAAANRLGTSAVNLRRRLRLSEQEGVA
jgi:hypothetical protein